MFWCCDIRYYQTLNRSIFFLLLSYFKCEISRSIAEETVGELEKEKTMKDLEMRDALAQHRSELTARDSQLQTLRDRDHENRATIDLQRKVKLLLLEEIIIQMLWDISKISSI